MCDRMEAVITNFHPMGFMDQAKDMYKLQKQAKQVKKVLKNIHIEAETDGVKVTVDGEQHVLSVEVSEAICGHAEKIGRAVADAMNKAIKKAQQVAAEKMKEVMGGFGGMFGQ